MPATDTATRSARPVGVPWRSPALVAILAATLVTPMDVPLISPALPAVRSAFGITAGRAGLLVTVYALPGIVLAPVLGAVADRIGPRRVLTGCLALFGTAGAAIALTESFHVALGLRLVQGVAAGSLLSALAMTAVGARYRGHRHDAVMGVTAAMLALGTAVYPFLGGYLAERAWNAPFLVYALAVPVAGLVHVGLDGPESRERSTDTGYLRAAIESVPTRRALALYGLMAVAFTLLFGGFYTVLPFHLAASLGLAPTAVGLVTSAVLLVTAALSTQNGRLAARTSRRTLVGCGFALYAVGLLGAALGGSLPIVVAALVAFGAGGGLLTPTIFAAISAMAPDRVRAGVMSLQATTIGLSQAVGPVAFLFAAGAVGYRTTLVGASAVALVFAAVVALAPSSGDSGPAVVSAARGGPTPATNGPHPP